MRRLCRKKKWNTEEDMREIFEAYRLEDGLDFRTIGPRYRVEAIRKKS